MFLERSWTLVAKAGSPAGANPQNQLYILINGDRRQFFELSLRLKLLIASNILAIDGVMSRNIRNR